MKKIYSKQSFVVGGQTHPVVFLHHIVADNTIAPYVTNLALGHSGFCWKAQLDYNKFADDCVGSLVSVLNQYPFIMTSEKPKLHQTLPSGCTEAVYALLMLMLPNLTCIAFPDAQGVSSTILRLVTEISRACRRDANTTHPLSRLSNLSLSCHARDADSGFYDVFTAFARLPSMRSLFGEGIDARRCSWDSNSDEASSTSIQRLTFKRSCIDTEPQQSLKHFGRPDRIHVLPHQRVRVRHRQTFPVEPWGRRPKPIAIRKPYFSIAGSDTSRARVLR